MQRMPIAWIASFLLPLVSAGATWAWSDALASKEVERLQRDLRGLLAKPLDSSEDGPHADGLACALAKHDLPESSQALRRLLLCTAPGGGGKWIWFSFSHYRKEYPERAARELVALLRDPETEVRRRAVLELTHIDLGHEKKREPILPVLARESKELIKALQANLKDKDEVVRWSSAEALLATRTPEAKSVVPLVLQWLKEKSPPDWDAFTALPFHGGVRSLFGDHWAGRILARSPEAALDGLLEAMPSASGAGSERLIKVTRSLFHVRGVDRDKLAKVFVSALESKESRTRILAIESLQQLGKAASTSRTALEKCLEDTSAEVRIEAVATLIELDATNPDLVIPVIKRLFEAGPKEMLPEVLVLAGKLGKPARPLIAHVLGVVEDQKSPHRLTAAYSLLQIDEARTAPAVKALAEILPKMPPGDVPPADLIRRLGRAAKPVLPELTDAFKRAKKNRQAAWAVALAFVDASDRNPGRVYVRGKLLGEYTQGDVHVQLARLGKDARQFLPEFKTALQEQKEAEALADTLHIVASIGPDARELLPVIRPLTMHKSQAVREEAAFALKSIQEKGGE